MIYLIKLIFKTIFDIIKHNPIKVFYILMIIFSYSMTEYVDQYVELSSKIHKVIIEENDDGTVNKYYYITENNTGYGLIVKDKPINIDEHNLYKYTEVSNIFSIFVGLFILFICMLFMSLLLSIGESSSSTHYNDSDELSWQFNVSYLNIRDKLLMKEITRKEDINRVYIILRGKILKVSSDMEYVPSNHELERFVNKYIDNKKILRDFKGTLVERRDLEIDKILEN